MATVRYKPRFYDLQKDTNCDFLRIKYSNGDRTLEASVIIPEASTFRDRSRAVSFVKNKCDARFVAWSQINYRQQDKLILSTLFDNHGNPIR